MSNGNTIVKIITNTNASSNSWIDPADHNTVFTTDELTNVINPYENFIKTLPGFISVGTEISGNTCTQTMVFDTPDNANSAFKQQYSSNKGDINPIVAARNLLYKNKFSSLGISHSGQLNYSNTLITIINSNSTIAIYII